MLVRHRPLAHTLRPLAAAFLAAAALLSTTAPAFAAASPAPTPTTGAAGRNFVTFGVAPAGAQGPDGRPNFTYLTSPGGFLPDRVALANYSNRPLRLRVYTTDATPTTDGTFALKLAAERTKDVGSWIRLGPAARRPITVPARTAAGPSFVVLPMSMRVPRGATPGDHVGGVVASLLVAGKKKTGPNLKFDQRVATRVNVRVSGALEPGLAVENVKATYRGTPNPVGRGQAVVTYTVRNTGNVRLAYSSKVTVSGLIGAWTSDPPKALTTLLPGGSIQVRTVVDGVVPEVLDRATVTVTPRSVGGDVNPALVSVSKTVRFWAVPWTLILIVAALVAYLLWRRTRRNRVTDAPSAPEPVDEAALA